ncbi:MAG: hypothetical protein ABI811_08880 [Acidobacteriota bacterium]
MNQAFAVLWAQWRTFRNYSGKSGAWLSIGVSVIWYGGWVVAAAIAAFTLADPEVDVLERALPGTLLLVSLYWQAVPLLMAASGLALDLGKLKPYPIPVMQLFGIELLLRSTAALEMMLLVIGGSIGILFNPVLPAWGALAAIPFIVFHMSLALGIRDVLMRLMNRRRVREIVAVLFVLFMTIPRLFFRPGAGLRKFFSEEFALAGIPNVAPVFPWTATAHLLTGKDLLAAGGTMLAWMAVGCAFALWQFRRTLAFDVEEARSGGSGRATAGAGKAGIVERFYRLPSALLRDPLGILIEKEIRYLARAPRFRMLFLMSCAFSLVVARALTRGGASAWGPSFLTGASAYSLLLLGEVCVWNSFGFDRSAAQIYFVAPLRFSRVLVAKNISAVFWIMVQLAASTGISMALGFPVTVKVIAEAAAVTGVVALFLLSAGNFISIRNARPADPQSSMRSRGAGGSQALLLLLYPVVFIPAALAYLARWALGSELAFFGLLAVLGVMGGVVYTFALEFAVEEADKRKETMVAALSAGQGPISS